MTDRDELVLVYNAADGIAAALFDAAHKIVSPGTYPCSLCAITYGAVAMRGAWKTYLRSLPHPVRFYHRDGFRRDWPGVTTTLPAVFLARDGTLIPLLDKPTLDAQRNVEELIAALDKALAQGAP